LETGVKKLYEAMFLIDSAEAAKDWDGVIELIRKILTKVEAEIVSIRKWDERPLAYTISGCNRGTYILTYFRADGQKITEVERDVQLSDRIMRALILRADHLTEEDIAKDTPATRTEKHLTQPEESPAAPDEAKQQSPAGPSEPVPEVQTADNAAQPLQDEPVAAESGGAEAQ
jgi:small subunit ribosomal protein S6